MSRMFNFGTVRKLNTPIASRRVAPSNLIVSAASRAAEALDKAELILQYSSGSSGPHLLPTIDRPSDRRIGGKVAMLRDQVARAKALGPPDLQEVCDLLALGLLRLRSRTAERNAIASDQGRDCGDIRLHSTARQRRHANPNRKGLA